MKTNTEPLLADSFYHVYNRGINGEDIFKEERNYQFFLNKYAQFVTPVAHTYSYCLLKNHFHLLIRTKSESEIREYYKGLGSKYEGKTIWWLISNAFASLFKSYAQAINIANSRTGGLFEEPFRRIVIDSDAYYSELIFYIHHNPQKHRFVVDFRDYIYSSYHSHLSDLPTLLMREEVLSWFGGKKNFELSHVQKSDMKYVANFDIEYD